MPLKNVKIFPSVRLGVDVGYHTSSSTTSSSTANNTTGDGFSGSLEYQQYFPLIKKLYAYAGAQTGYGFDKSEGNKTENKSNIYHAGAYGGITWFAFKHFAFETTLLSASMIYAERTSKENTGVMLENKVTQFDLSTRGSINNLGFRIYFLF